MLLPELSEIHDCCLALMRLAGERFGGDLSGKLLLREGFDADGVALLIAGSIAGAASLCVEGDAERLREGLRHGFCDFVVAHPDEALRILKNEVRRGLPVSVGLGAAPQPCIAEMIERGVQPDLVSGLAAAPTALLAERGAIPLPPADSADPAMPLTGWTTRSEPARWMPRIAQIAAEALDPASDDTPARRRWLESAPRYLGRAFQGALCVRMTVAEASAFEVRVQAEVPEAAVSRR